MEKPAGGMWGSVARPPPHPGSAKADDHAAKAFFQFFPLKNWSSQKNTPDSHLSDIISVIKVFRGMDASGGLNSSIIRANYAQKWLNKEKRRGRDSNPGYPLGYTAFPMPPNRPLWHLSRVDYYNKNSTIHKPLCDAEFCVLQKHCPGFATLSILTISCLQ